MDSLTGLKKQKNITSTRKDKNISIYTPIKKLGSSRLFLYIPVKRDMKKEYPQPGEIYHHYKGGKYEIVAMCNHTETDEILVVYKSLSFGGFHARPFIEWDELMVSNNHRDIKRFQRIDK